MIGGTDGLLPAGFICERSSVPSQRYQSGCLRWVVQSRVWHDHDLTFSEQCDGQCAIAQGTHICPRAA